MKSFGSTFRSARLQRLESLEQRVLLAGDTISAAEAEQRIGGLQEYYEEVMTSGAHDEFLDLSVRVGTNGLHLYNLQFAVDGVLSMYEATGDRQILDAAIQYVTNAMDAAETIDGGYYESDGFFDWEVLSGDQPRARRQGFALYDLQFGSAMSRLGRIISEDVRLHDDVELQAFGEELVAFVDAHVIRKWLDARGIRASIESYQDTNGFWIDTSTHVINICHNLEEVLGSESSCRDVSRQLAEQFKQQLVLQQDGSYTWGLWGTLPSGHDHLAPDTGHENRVATMVWLLGGDGEVFDATDIERFAKTFTQRIWNGRSDWEASPGVQDSPWFHNYIDGSDASYRNYSHYRDGTPGMNGFVYDGWVRLGQFDLETQNVGESLLDFMREFSWGVNAIRQRNGTSYGKIAITGHLARNLRFAEYVETAETPLASAATAAEVTSEFLLGDVDRDGIVGFSDFLVLSQSFGQQVPEGTGGDFDYDGVVQYSDFVILAASFGSSPSPAHRA